MKNYLIAFYPKHTGFSGQRFASELLIEGLRKSGWQISIVYSPGLDRLSETTLNRIFFTLRAVTLAIKLFFSWVKVLAYGWSSQILYVNLGQTKFALIRDGLPLVIRKFFYSYKAAVISLHGSLFMTWSYQSFNGKVIRLISQKANYITVLGAQQQLKLVQLGIPQEKIVMIDNTCSLPAISEAEIWLKHNPASPSNTCTKPVTILYLSSLIESKGYPEFIEAIAHLATTTEIAINGILCGNINIGRDEANQFSTHSEAKAWIETKINQINQSPSVRLRWVDGAVGEEKEQLFRQAQIFVLPSRYKVEAQPIVILEALASGCAVITTKVGEIPSTVSQETAVLLDECSSNAIAKTITDLCEFPDKRQQLALNGLKLFNRRFSYEQHINRWKEILQKMHF
jgi:glycosyltransferase involved in cell wall biosynthesis